MSASDKFRCIWETTMRVGPSHMLNVYFSDPNSLIKACRSNVLFDRNQ